MPFPGTPTYDRLLTIQKPVGRGLLNLVREVANCGAVGRDIEASVTTQLGALRTPGGKSMVETWQAELGVQVRDIARWLIFREVQNNIVVGVEPPSLKEEFTLLRASKFAMGLFGKGRSPGQAAVSEVEVLFAKLSDMLVPSLIVLTYAPAILGFIQGVYLAMMPVVILWALVPGAQGRPLVLYFVWLGILYSSPIWWGMIELFTETFSDVSPSFLSNPAEWTYTAGLRLLLHTLGIVVALIMGTLATGLTGLMAAFAKFH